VTDDESGDGEQNESDNWLPHHKADRGKLKVHSRDEVKHVGMSTL